MAKMKVATLERLAEFLTECKALFASQSETEQKQDKNDDTLKTDNKSVVGAINEINGRVPSTSAANAGKVLTTNESGTPEWQDIDTSAIGDISTALANILSQTEAIIGGN